MYWSFALSMGHTEAEARIKHLVVSAGNSAGSADRKAESAHVHTVAEARRLAASLAPKYDIVTVFGALTAGRTSEQTDDLLKYWQGKKQLDELTHACVTRGQLGK